MSNKRVPIAAVRFVAELYPRESPSDEAIARYRAAAIRADEGES
jgi:hypothetical protein